MRRRFTDRHIIRIGIAFLLITIGIVIILSYIPVWIWLCVIGAVMIVLGCLVLKIWR